MQFTSWVSMLGLHVAGHRIESHLRQSYNNNNSCAESTARWPITRTETAQHTNTNNNGQ
jgi:hypothetical protein